MSKGIIIIDIPNLESHEIDSYDMVADLKVKSLVLGGERYNCEFENVIVRPLPQKKNPFEEHMKVESNERYISETLINQIRGYNYCLDEILGGTE